MSNFFRAMQLGTYLLAWLTRASADGKITVEELAEGVAGALRVADLDVAIELPGGEVVKEPSAPGGGA